MQLGHYLVQIADRDLCSVHKFERAPANCRRVRINSSNSSANLKKGHDKLLKKLSAIGYSLISYHPVPRISTFCDGLHPVPRVLLFPYNLEDCDLRGGQNAHGRPPCPCSPADIEYRITVEFIKTGYPREWDLCDIPEGVYLPPMGMAR